MYIESYKKLTVWQKSMELAREIYRATGKLPPSEAYGLISQMRRSSVSIPSNIAEGYKRGGLAEYIKFLGISEASAAELETQVILTKDLFSNIDFTVCENLLLEVQKMLVVMIGRLRSKNPLTAKSLKLKAKSAFTIVELLVAMSIFTIGIVIATGSFVRALRTQRALTHLMSINSNASLVLEQMAREIRTGYDFTVNGGSVLCAEGGEELGFTNAKGNAVTYKKSGEEILRQECPGDDCSLSIFSPLTASDAAVKRICFIENQPDPSVDPWRLTIVLETGSSRPDLAANFINLQTTISSRVLPSDIAP